MKKIRCTAAIAGVVLLAGCGSSDRPSAAEISQALQDESMGGTVLVSVADCIAEEFYESDLSDEALQSIVDQDEDFEPSTADTEVMQELTTTAFTACADSIDPSELENDTE